MSRPARACIDLAAYRHNLQRVHALAPNAKIIAVIKANAYGHGVVEAARALDECDSFGVACMEEAVRLREAGVKKKLLLLEGVFEAPEIPIALELDVDIVLHQEEQLQWLEQATLPRPIPVWIKLNTGMNRLGFAPQRAGELWQRVAGCPNAAKPARWMSHLACSEERDNPATEQQLALFDQAVATYPAPHSIANSGGILYWPQAHRDWVRPGIMLYGVSPGGDRLGADLQLQPVMRLSSRLIAVHMLKKGQAIGYGGTWVCPQDMPVGVVAIGYGDGYPRHAKSGTPVMVHGTQVPLVGRVSMDMICLDLRLVPQARHGDRVVLWGPELPVETVARHAETIAYELLCGVTHRVHFEYR